MIKIFEHNLYKVKTDTSATKEEYDGPQIGLPWIDQNHFQSVDQAEKIKLLRKGFEDSASFQEQFGQMFVKRVTDRLLAVTNDEPNYDLTKLATDQTYLSKTAFEIKGKLRVL